MTLALSCTDDLLFHDTRSQVHSGGATVVVLSTGTIKSIILCDLHVVLLLVPVL
jgi:hypothetical protein